MKQIKRKWRNYLIQPRVQLKWSILVAVLILLFFVGLNLWSYYRISNITRVMTEWFGLSGELRDIILKIRIQLFIEGLLAGLVILLFVFAGWIVLTHRIYGSIFAFKRYVDQLINGEYNKPLKLRDKDEFKDLADSLNRLAKQLAAGQEPKLSPNQNGKD